MHGAGVASLGLHHILKVEGQGHLWGEESVCFLKPIVLRQEYNRSGMAGQSRTGPDERQQGRAGQGQGTVRNGTGD